MPSIPFEDFRSNTTTFIDWISQQVSDVPPTTRIIELETEQGKTSEFNRKFSPSEKFINQPSKKYDAFIEEALEHFRELAENDINPYSTHGIHEKADQYGQLAWKVMDYEGDFAYSESSLRGVWEDHLEDNEEQFHQYRVIVPLLNFVGTGDSVSLASAESEVHPHQDTPFPVENLTISRLTDEELSAIMTYEGLRIGDDIGIQPSPLAFNLPDYKLEIEFRSDRYASFGFRSVRTGVDVVSPSLFEKADTLGEQVVTALHLHNVDAEPDQGLPYLVYDDWRTYRDDVQSADIYRDWMPGYTPTLTDPRYQGANYQMPPDRVTELEEFWRRYHSVIGQGEEFKEALHRFTQMFTGKTDRDDLVDAAIAFESLLTVGSDWGTISTTIALHGSVLLDSRCDYNRSSLWRFLKNVYTARSKVVHDSMGWNEIVADDDLVFELMAEEQPSLGSFVDTTREILAEIILAYMECRIDADQSVGMVNETIFDTVRNAEYNPASYG